MKTKYYQFDYLLVLILLLFCSLFIDPFLYSQNKSEEMSAGPAPITNKISRNNTELDAAIGTRIFTQNYVGTNFQFGKSFLESCDITNIGAPFSIQFPGGLVLVEGKLYTWNQYEPFQVWRIDTVTGAHTLEFNITGVPLTYLTGITWDGTTMYGVATNASSISVLLTINTITGVCNPVGPASTLSKSSISLSGRLGVNNGLFSVDIMSDSLIKWNKSTGIAQVVGALNCGNISFGQDAQFDNRDGKLYWYSYSSIEGAALRTIDTATGSGSSIICNLPSQGTGIAPFYPSRHNFIEVIQAPVNIQIDDYTLISDSVLFPFQGNGSTVINVNYRIINLSHTWDADLRMYAQHQNTGAMIVNWVGGSGDNFINTVLSDSAIIPIASGTAPFDGIFRPSNPLNVFNGLSPNGYWKLLVSDSASGDTGVLTGWSILVTYQNPTGGINTVEIPNYYSLAQNYPNPFNPVTRIKYTLPKAEYVKISVYDILGKEIKTFVNAQTEAGIHEVTFDASSLSSGVYFYRIEAGKYTASKKMMVIK